jgi:hypothetical protein
LVFPNEKRVLETFLVVPPLAGDYSRRPTPHEEPNFVVTNDYAFDLVKCAKEAVGLASKVSIRCDSKGVMSLQSMCEVGDGRQSFVDFRFLPSDI